HRLRRDGNHEIVAFDMNEDARHTVEAFGATTATSLQELVAHLSPRRIVWIMVPAGDPTESTIRTLLSFLSAGDIIIDGGNSKFTDSLLHAELCRNKGVSFIDAGTSGGIWGLEIGYCLMVGGDADAVSYATPIFTTLAPPDGFLHVGPVGSGHYVKMIHNGIEYGLLEAYAEGFSLLRNSKRFENLDLHAIAHLWNQGSVVRSWLLELAERALDHDPDLESIEGWVDDSGEGRWTVFEAIDASVPTPVLALSLMARFASRGEDEFGNRMIAALRNEFGGHAMKVQSATEGK
ncbi:MAG: phosphogluconate dehydrogenase (NAD(+)-dependent, decarboxylating), partial [Candidatus Dormibacteria bacterium]